MRSRWRCIVFLVLWVIQLRACAARGRSAFTTYPPAFKIPRPPYPARTTASPAPWPSPNTPKSSLLMGRAVCIWYVACFSKTPNVSILLYWRCLCVCRWAVRVPSLKVIFHLRLYFSVHLRMRICCLQVCLLYTISYINDVNRVDKAWQMHWKQ